MDKKFEEETGEAAWLRTYSEKYAEEREYLNPNYILWINNYIDKILKKNRI